MLVTAMVFLLFWEVGQGNSCPGLNEKIVLVMPAAECIQNPSSLLALFTLLS
jgi:hypothetical protein